MKLQIDTSAKTIKLDQTVSLSELVDMLEKMLPGEWKTYKLETNTVINNWNHPIVIERNVWPRPFPWYEITMTNKPALHDFTFSKTDANLIDGHHRAAFVDKINYLGDLDEHGDFSKPRLEVQKGIYNFEYRA